MDRSRIGLFFTNFHDLFCDHVLALIEQDVGCGVGGPMRAIARHTGARVTGINNNSYQLARLDMHNRNGGLDRQCDGVKVGRLCLFVFRHVLVATFINHSNPIFSQGDFMKMPFADGTFDGAYSIEATCHGALLGC
jgi:SAM-dependent methyltransferase